MLWLCATCGVEYRNDPHLGEGNSPERCPICEDERQYVPAGGQVWTSIRQLQADGKHVAVTAVDEGLWGLTAADVGIGQQGMLVQTDGGNLLFDVPGLIDQDAIDNVRKLGGLAAIVPSHPHMYGVQSQWSHVFGDVPVWIAAADQHWLGVRPPSTRIWSEPFEILPGVWLDQVGGHFPGSSIAYWADGASGQGVLLAGDAIFPVADGSVTFLRSYPNRIPLSPGVVRRMADHVYGYSFDVLYNNFGASVGPNAADIVQRSAQRYIDWGSGVHDHLT